MGNRWRPDLHGDNLPIGTPQLVSDGAGGAIITWQDYPSDNYNIYAQRVDASGEVLWTTDGVPICTAVGNQKWPQLVTDAAGGAIITWHDERSDSADIYAQNVNPDGTLGGGGADITPPSVITDLTASNPTPDSITLTWTAPGDDGDVGTASRYDIRYSTSPIDEGNWDDAAQVVEEPPELAGSAENFVVMDLSPGTTYYFAQRFTTPSGMALIGANPRRYVIPSILKTILL